MNVQPEKNTVLCLDSRVPKEQRKVHVVCQPVEDAVGVRLSLPVPHDLRHLDLAKADYLANKRDIGPLDLILQHFSKMVKALSIG